MTELVQMLNVGKKYRTRRSGLIRPEYTEVEALHDANFTISKGQTIAFLGPNGAGKSTLCRIAAGMIKPTGGRALLDGVDITRNIREVSKNIGVVLGPTMVYYRITGYQYLKFFARVYGVNDYDQRIHEMARAVDLEKWLSSHVESYSTGMKMRISLARALLHDPEFLVLDEFTMSLDPLGAFKVRNLIREARKTVLLTTHNPAEAEAMADRVAFMAKGRIVALDSLQNMMSDSKHRIELSVLLRDAKGAKEALRGFEGLDVIESPGGEVRVLATRDELPSMIFALAKLEILRIETSAPGLEEAYLNFTGEALNQPPADRAEMTRVY